ncbi:MAG: DUF3179 domain-containing protein [Ahrensia sp.]|nr:DUF3179 domain-containing protein [Ahrensia sp.]
MKHRFLKLIAVLSILAAHASPSYGDPIRWNQEGWKTDFSITSIDLAKVLDGGPPRDGIPSIDDPQFKQQAQITDIKDTEPVVGLKINGEAKAYPVRILTWHEIVNDMIGDVPVAVTYCPLCNSSIVFDRRINGNAVEFGTTGKLKDSNLIMYDRGGDNWWQQFTGEAIAGTATGNQLALIPSRLQSFGEFKAENPNGLVLVPTNPNLREYGRNPYVGYDLSGAPFLYRGDLPDYINPMERVVVVRRGDTDPIIVAMKKITQAGILSIDGYELTWRAGQNSALDQADMSIGRDVGTVLVQKDGKDVVYDVTFAFVAHAFHPNVKIAQE